MFVEYVQEINESNKTNNRASRKIDAIYLTVNFRKKGGYVVLYLKSGLPITRRKVTDISVNNLDIKAVGNMAADNKITTLKFDNKSGVLLHPNYWLAGVHYKQGNK